MAQKIKIWPGMPVELPDVQYAKSDHGTDLNEGLTNCINKENAKDVYGNSLLVKGDEADKYATESKLDPNALENPEGGSFAETGNLGVSVEELAKPSKLGEDLKYEGKTNFDISHIARNGGDYSIGPDVVGNDLSWAAKPLEEIPSMVNSMEATPNYLGQDEDRTVAM